MVQSKAKLRLSCLVCSSILSQHETALRHYTTILKDKSDSEKRLELETLVKVPSVIIPSASSRYKFQFISFIEFKCMYTIIKDCIGLSGIYLKEMPLWKELSNSQQHIPYVCTTPIATMYVLRGLLREHFKDKGPSSKTEQMLTPA